MERIQAIIDAVRKKCVAFPRSKKLCIDKQIISFTGTTTLRQYVKNKPNPEGLKKITTDWEKRIVFVSIEIP